MVCDFSSSKIVGKDFFAHMQLKFYLDVFE